MLVSSCFLRRGRKCVATKADLRNGVAAMAVRQLAERRGDGIVVELFWNDSEGQVFVEYRDERR